MDKVTWLYESEYRAGEVDRLAGITFAHHESDAWKAGWLKVDKEIRFAMQA